MKKAYNFLLAVIFSFTIIITSFSLTVMSKRLQLKTVNKSEVIDKIYEETNVDKDIVRKDLKDYVNSKYKTVTYENKKYENNINFFLVNGYKSIIYVITIIFIIITGYLFNKTKNGHNIYTILLITSFILISFYGAIYITVDTNIIFNYLLNIYLHFILLIADIFFILGIVNKVEKCLNQLLRNKISPLWENIIVVII